MSFLAIFKYLLFFTSLHYRLKLTSKGESTSTSGGQTDPGLGPPHPSLGLTHDTCMLTPGWNDLTRGVGLMLGTRGFKLLLHPQGAE